MSIRNIENIRSVVLQMAAGLVLLLLIVLFLQLRQNGTEMRNAMQAMQDQVDATQSLELENQDLRELTHPKVILIIGDGMDDQQITIARNYLAGSHGKLTIDGMPFRGVALVQAVSEQDPERAVYISDSANTATSLATGRLTSPRRIATTARTDEDIRTIMEMAIAAGVGTGIVSTASVTDATPASFVAHISNRLCQAPADMVREDDEIAYNNRDCSDDFKANGGMGSIAEQIAASKIDLVLGGGSGFFDHASEVEPDTSVAALARRNGYKLIGKRSQLANLEAGSRVLGLFSAYTMPVRMRGVDRAEAQWIDREDGVPKLPEPFACEKNPGSGDVPSLAEMTRAAIDYLDKKDRFMLMVESASIDKQAHVRRPCGHIGEVGQLDEALDVALKYAASRPEVLILVTADHGSAAHIIAETSRWAPQDKASPGHFARVLTPEGSIMGVNYASNDARQEEHTGVQVPVYASGFGAERLPTTMTQTEIFEISARHLGLR